VSNPAPAGGAFGGRTRAAPTREDSVSITNRGAPSSSPATPPMRAMPLGDSRCTPLTTCGGRSVGVGGAAGDLSRVRNDPLHCPVGRGGGADRQLGMSKRKTAQRSTTKKAEPESKRRWVILNARTNKIMMGNEEGVSSEEKAYRLSDSLMMETIVVPLWEYRGEPDPDAAELEQ
jgi:hypothetical protein